MTFSINGIKEERIERFNFEILICADSYLVARKLLEQNNVLVLSFKDYTLDKTTFGDIYFTMNVGTERVDVVTKFHDIAEACDFFVFLWFDITEMNSFTTPITQEASQIFITKAQEIAIERQAKIKEDIAKQSDKAKAMFEDKDLKSAREIILKIVARVDLTTRRSGKMIETRDLKKIEWLTEDLKKQRMGTNFEKIKLTISELLTIIDTYDRKRYANTQDPITIFPESIITTMDLKQEMEHMEMADIIKGLHMKMPIKKLAYASIGAFTSLFKFLGKDILYKIADPTAFLSTLYDMTEFVFIIILTLLGIYTVANDLYLFSAAQLGLAYSMITLGLRWLLIFAANYLKKQSLLRMLIMIPLIIALHYLIIYFITTNFAI